MKETSKSDRGYSLRLTLLFAALIVSVGWMGVNFSQIEKHDANQLEILTDVGTLRVQSQLLGNAAMRAVSGNVQALSEITRARAEFEATVGKLQGGVASGSDTQGELVMPNDQAIAAAKKIADVWAQMRGDVDRLLARREAVTSAYGLAGDFYKQLGQTRAPSDAVAARLVDTGAASTQVGLASQQQLLLERLNRNVTEVLQGRSDAAAASTQFGEDAVLFGQVLQGLMRGDRALGVDRVSDAQARAKLADVASAYSVLNGQVAQLLKSFPAVFEARKAAEGLLVNGDKMSVEAAGLRAAVEPQGMMSAFSAQSVLLPAAMAFLFLMLIGYTIIGRSRALQEESDRQRSESEDVNKRTQAAILTLLDEMSTLADGDLTAKATVTEEITGAIADSVNYAIDELRKLVATINITSDQVARAARQTRSTAINLAEASDHQAQQISSATQSINQMAGSIEQVSKNAQESADVAKRSLDIAHKGSDTVQRTILGMDNIREQIQETSKRIKRLGESSQEIGAIVGLINDIADQTNILALNAAIQAAMAGEAGRGFAVVADEVQRLAERSTDATKQIEALIKTIQTDTNEAVHSMEQSTAGVVAGAKLAEDAGVALTEIETVSGRLFELVTSISDASVQQSRAATEVSNTMNVIQDITKQVSTGTSETAESIGNLAELANELHDSVAGFKLPVDEMAGYETLVGEAIPELGAEAVVEPDLEDFVSLGDSDDDELDLMAELSLLHDTDRSTAPREKTRSLDEMNLDEMDHDELSAAVLEELAAELDATGESGLDVDLGRSADAGRK